MVYKKDRAKSNTMDVFKSKKSEEAKQAKLKQAAEFYKISVAELEKMYRNMEARREAEELRILNEFVCSTLG